MAKYTVLTCGIGLDSPDGVEDWGLMPTDVWADDPTDAWLKDLFAREYAGWVRYGRPKGACPKIVRDDANYAAYQRRQWERHEAQVLAILNSTKRGCPTGGTWQNSVTYKATRYAGTI